jgi:putative transcriptional regulator
MMLVTLFVEVAELEKFDGQRKERGKNEPSPPKAIRQKLKLSQSAFASLMGVSSRTLQDWEQGRRKPQGPAKSLLRIAEQHPEIFIEVS